MFHLHFSMFLFLCNRSRKKLVLYKMTYFQGFPAMLFLRGRTRTEGPVHLRQYPSSCKRSGGRRPDPFPPGPVKSSTSSVSVKRCGFYRNSWIPKTSTPSILPLTHQPHARHVLNNRKSAAAPQFNRLWSSGFPYLYTCNKQAEGKR